MEKLFFDLETTGPDINVDRIVQLAILVTDDTGKIVIRKSNLINPEIPISDKATEIHGIKNSDVQNKPKFSGYAKALKPIFENKIIITYNGLAFDIPLLMNEFDRAGVEVTLSGKFIDVYKVENALSPRSLSNVYKQYTGETLEGAHDAMADVNATATILERQCEKFSILKDEELMKLSGMENVADYYGKLVYDAEGYLCFNFGKKCKGRRISADAECEKYANWILGENFPKQVKTLIREEQKRLTKKAFTKPSFNPAHPDSHPGIVDELPF